MDVRVGSQRRLSAEELMLSNCGAGEDLESPLGSKEIKPINPKGNQPWIFIGRTAAEASTLWPPDAKSRLTGKDWCWERLRAGGDGATEDELAGWHHRLNGSKFEQTPWDSEGQGSLVSQSPIQLTWVTEQQQHCWLTMLWQFQMDSKRAQPYIYMHPFSPSFPFPPGCRITSSRVACAPQYVLIGYPF